jgi:hypothetical protein
MGDNDFSNRYPNDFPAVGFLQQYVRGMNDFSQEGTDIPSLRLQDQYAQESGGPLIGQQLISSTPSFDLNMPRLPGNQDVRGIPNATPEMLRKLQERKLKNPGGQEDLPGFLKSV